MRKLSSFVLASLFLMLVLFWLSLPASGQARADSHRPDFRPGTLIVKFKDASSQTERSSALAASQAREGASLIAGGPKRVVVPRGQELAKLARLRADPAVDYANLDHAISIDWTPNDPLFGDQWGLTQVRAPEAWDTTKGEGVTVAVIDTGADLSHPDLAANLVPGYDFVSGDSSADDDNGHGTHVSGIIAAAGNNGTGGLGIAPAAKIMPLKALDASGAGWESDIIRAIGHATDRGARVINMSFGQHEGSDSLRDAVDIAWNKGVLLVAAAGNANANVADYPGAYDRVISIAATDPSDQKAYFSNYGSFVGISAPGVSIRSTLPRGIDVSGYGNRSGTSMAAPLVSGVGALAFAVGQCQQVDNSAVRQAIQAAARSLDAVNPEYVGQLGRGRLDAAAALAALPPPPVLTAASNRVAFIARAGDTALQQRTVSLSTAGCATPLSTTITSSGGHDWLSASARSSPTPSLTISVTPGSVPAGQYSATVTVRYARTSSPEAAVTADLLVVPQVYGVGIPELRKSSQ